MIQAKRQAFIIVDLGYGDAGKGTITDFLTRQHNIHTIIRYNGGAQAAHNVVTLDGKHHTFSQFGSGIFVPNVQTYLSQFMLIEPYAIFNEEEHLQSLGVMDGFERMLIHRQALVITPYQQAANRLRELARGNNRHGSCGIGIGETMSDYLEHGDDVLFAGDLPYPDKAEKKLQFLRDKKYSEIKSLLPQVRHLDSAQSDLGVFGADDPLEIAIDNYQYLTERVRLVDDADAAKIFQQSGTIIFEGAQGVLLDENYGFAPYNTWSNTTSANAHTLLQQHDYDGDVTTFGILRTYATRHGAGPFVTEDAALAKALPEQHNETSEWQSHFRVGYFDVLNARYALQVTGGVDALAMTHADKIDNLSEKQLCKGYRINGETSDLSQYFELDNEIITGIKVNTPPDIAHQTQLAQYLFQCEPIYTPIDGDYLDEIEHALGVPIKLVSSGMTASDKRLISTQEKNK